ncbi:hypothetical protein SmJEL517_g05391 [Synchytrium microbalum]|uniref:Peptidase S9 prolyl oligopeptidase catalytic domain-containing protein n=1 Tax=Synchytrium microbalum TaxID=1806994 RepID=A0A507BPI1_9FUNG|nr:uncharacterized protein SmJEL517_g05391 [Synchytrium microbalum]TPX31267.1 hypothetical protein SmJEL517_g05391 [Synchytrium microbalum]
MTFAVGSLAPNLGAVPGGQQSGTSSATASPNRIAVAQPRPQQQQQSLSGSSWTRASVLASGRVDGRKGPQGVKASSLSGHNNIPPIDSTDDTNLSESEPLISSQQRRSAGPYIPQPQSVQEIGEEDGTAANCCSCPWNVRTGVHEYGGNPAVAAGDVVVFSDFKLRQLFRIDKDSEIKAITPETLSERFADISIHPSLKYLVCVHEVHGQDEHDVTNQLSVVSLDSSSVNKPVVVAPSHGQPHRDFYSAPRFSPDGKHLCWVEWDHPNMPWTRTNLVVAEWDGSKVQNIRKVSDGQSSISQPRWSRNGQSLLYLSDESGFYNIYRHHINSKTSSAVLKQPLKAEFGSPDWTFGNSTYVPLPNDSIMAYFVESGVSKLSLIDANGGLRILSTTFIDVSGLTVVNSGEKPVVYFTAGTKTEGKSLYKFDIATETAIVVKKTSDVDISDRYISAAQSIEFPTANGKTAYAYLYLPKNDDYKAPDGELPPLILRCHGGPTSHCVDSLSSRIQFYTSRGFAFVDVNYGGSSNYGTEYRERLNNKWGVVDLEDSCAVALYLAEKNLVDRKRLAITGGSAGKPDVFTAGASSYGVSDLVSLFQFTHKFESHYLEMLIGGTPTTAAELYHDRSPIHFADKIKAPLLVLQGTEDRVVPPSQSQAIVDSITHNGGLVKYVLMEGEGHGFRKSENIVKSVNEELHWYQTVFKTGDSE